MHKQLADSITLRWFVRALLFALPAFCPAALPPLAPTRAGVEIVDGSPIRFHRLSTADGLSQTRVSHIVQDDRGFMWFGTQYGLNRFDGYRFKVFVHDPAKSESLSGVYAASTTNKLSLFNKLTVIIALCVRLVYGDRSRDPKHCECVLPADPAAP